MKILLIQPTQIGDIKKECEVGLKGINKVICCACIDCGRKRWVQFYKKEQSKPKSLRCRSCSAILKHPRGDKSQFWKGGRQKHSGYIKVFLEPNDPYYSMADKKGYVFEHRLVVAQGLKRCLLTSEYVHHVNGIKTDNRDENLKLTTTHEHHYEQKDMIRNAYLGGLRDGAKGRDTELLREIRLQRWQIKELQEQVRLLTSHFMEVKQ